MCRFELIHSPQRTFTLRPRPLKSAIHAIHAIQVVLAHRLSCNICARTPVTHGFAEQIVALHIISSPDPYPASKLIDRSQVTVTRYIVHHISVFSVANHPLLFRTCHLMHLS